MDREKTDKKDTSQEMQEPDVCTKAFDPESYRAEDEDSPCKNGEG